jgi:heterodisulfide reductase subunit A-like polyferredoxin
MAATKEAVIAKSHHSELEPTIFFMDLRAQGKGFDSYCERAKEQSGVRYIRSMISRVVENPVTHDLELTYQDPETGQKVEEIFDLVVLAVGLSPSAEAVELSKRLGLELDQYGFAQTPLKNPLQTSREGIYVCGGFEAPKDIPETVAQASAVAAEATRPLAGVRGYEITKPVLPPERSLFGIDPKIGVFVCCCGTNIAGVVDVEAVAEYSRELPNVVWSEVFLFACSTDSKVRMKELILEHDINRVIVASCSPKTHETLFMDTLREAGLNPYLFEMANIRNQCSWVHSDQSELATQKSKDLIRMSVKRLTRQEPIVSQPVPVLPVGLVVGGGLAGLTAAKTIADQGFRTHIVEQSDYLGGRYQDSLPTLEGFDPAAYIPELIEAVEKHPQITVHTNAQVEKIDGHVGGFVSNIKKQSGGSVSLRHGTAIIATGAEPYVPEEYLYGRHKGVLTQKELEQVIRNDRARLESLNSVIMIQCVGSRNEDNPYCSRVCCSQAVGNALRLKEARPEMEVIVLCRDIRTFGLKEQYYKKARQKGVLFIRYELDRLPEVFEKDSQLSIRFLEPGIRREILLSPDLVVLSAAMKPHSLSSSIAEVYKLPRDDRGYFLEAHVKLRPLDFTTDGMFLCGDGHSPKFPEEVIVQAKGAAGRALSILSKKVIEVGPSSQVDPELCAACMTCVRTCPYSVPYINEHGVSQIDPARCRGCGLCASECPAQAISVHHYLDEQIEAKIQGLFEAQGASVFAEASPDKWLKAQGN